MCPAFPRRPSRSTPSSTIPPPTPVDTTMAMKSSQPIAAPRHPSPSASALASLSTAVGTPTRSATRGWRGNPLPPLDVERGDRRTTPLHRSSAADPAHAAQPAVRRVGDDAEAISASSPAQTASGSCECGVGTWSASRTAPSRSTRPAAILVPPMSTARQSGSTLRWAQWVAVEPSAKPGPGVVHRALDPGLFGTLRAVLVDRAGQVVPTGLAHATKVALKPPRRRT